ncbi:TIGR00266 family protein [Lactobacillus nasalidis]|uniref:TIGR00266 family protein n=1 Tax=Lactobacillus nasalidis TaxID=2797258 RepID=A0ABQ3W665_9LACO|nr:TIGR00266 family protein [Lactobacillus nasalidis]GHV97175.1 TIGR00266 family protein [Lactobacillus nasalidis]GHV98932.1 TIGR00266 family protein [Lactobacillus nasalidis]GHW00840.1 TIGR00266 family protein [Lactobacillus nasalidis]
MKYELSGGNTCPLAAVTLNKGENIKVESGAMVYMKDVTITGKMNSGKKGLGGLLGAIGRSLTSGESMFITQATGDADGGQIGIAPAIPGKIAKLSVGKKQYCLNTGAFLASDDSVSYKMQSQKLSKAVFGGTGGLFVMQTEGEGDMLVNAFGDLVELTVTSDEPISIDNEHVVAWDADLDYDIQVASGMFGFTSGEGLVNHFTGDGKVLIQTRNIRSLAEALQPYIIEKNSNS